MAPPARSSSSAPTPPSPPGPAQSSQARSQPARSRSRRPVDLLEAARAGDRAAVGRLLSLVERGGADAREVGRICFAAGQADHVIGITGAPGAGKSTLTDRLIGAARAGGSPVGVLAVDPSSPYSGGAILGDRIRMQGHALDEGVFVRSMATRGHLGGLALAAPEAIRVLAATGRPLVLVETVGVGQVEVEIAGAADTTVVVVNPGWGDAVQAAKAGLLEVADVFAVNKADRPGADEARRDLESMLDMSMGMGEWRPPVVMTSAATGDGVDGLWSAIGDHRSYLAKSGELERRRSRRLLDELRRVMISSIERDVRSAEAGETYDRITGALLRRELDPYDAAAELLSAGCPPADPRVGPAGPRSVSAAPELFTEVRTRRSLNSSRGPPARSATGQSGPDDAAELDRLHQIGVGRHHPQRVAVAPGAVAGEAPAVAHHAPGPAGAPAPAAVLLEPHDRRVGQLVATGDRPVEQLDRHVGRAQGTEIHRDGHLPEVPQVHHPGALVGVHLHHLHLRPRRRHPLLPGRQGP